VLLASVQCDALPSCGVFLTGHFCIADLAKEQIDKRGASKVFYKRPKRDNSGI
jgi:hypothetical protein